MEETVKPPYRSRVRAEAALRTRRLIREAATALFIERGVAATTMRQIAASAGVGERTVYAVFPTKAALFVEALNVAVAGDEDQVPIARRAVFEAYKEERDPVRAVELFVGHAASLYERAGDLTYTAFESSGADADMRALIEGAKAAMTTNMHSVALAWERSGLLRAGLDPGDAAAILYTLTGPLVHHQLRRDQGWSAERYTRWLSETLLQTVVRPTD